MMEISDEVRAAWQSEGEARETLYRQAVDALTAAAKLTRTTAGGSVEQGDFAEFLVQAVAAVAANLGSIEAVTAGRPGSWESALVHNILTGALSGDPSLSELLARRTSPIRIPLNVPDVVAAAGLPDADQAAWAITWPGTVRRGEGGEEVREIGESPEEQAALERYEAQFNEVYERYAAAYTSYAERFQAEALAYALTLDGLAGDSAAGDSATLRIPVEFDIETTDSWPACENPDPYDGDPIVTLIWEAARERAGLPEL